MLATAVLLGSGAAWAQDGGGPPPLVWQAVKLIALWVIGGWLLYLGSLTLAARLAGLQTGFAHSFLATLLGGAVALVPLLALGLAFGDSVSQPLWSLYSQAVLFGAFWWAIRTVFNTDGARALLVLLVGSIVAVGVASGLLLILF